MSKKIVGVICDFVKNDTSTMLKTPYYRVREKYLNILQDVSRNIMIIFIPYVKSQINNYIKLCDGIVLVGGDDIPPEMYGEKSTLKDEQVLQNRYEFEIPFVKKYIKTGKPIFGICAGMQSINVALRGTLYQDIKDITKEKHGQKEKFDKPLHEIEINKNSLFYKILKTKTASVNSMHHQSIKKLGKNLVISAKTDDIVEAIELKNHKFCIGVQWHPEWQSSIVDKKLFKAFCGCL